MFELHHPKQSTVTLQNWLTVGQQIFGNMAFELKRVDGETKDANALDGSSSQSENSVGCRSNTGWVKYRLLSHDAKTLFRLCLPRQVANKQNPSS